MTCKIDMDKICYRGVDLSLLLLFVFPILPLRIAGFAIIPLAIFTILNIGFNGVDQKNDESWLVFLAFILLPIIYLTELIYTENLPFVWQEVQRKMGLIILPFIFMMLHHSKFKPNVDRYLKAFVFSVSGLVLYASILLLFAGVNQEYLLSGGLPFALRTTTEELVNLHPTYFGLVIAFSATVLIERISRTVKVSKFSFTQALRLFVVLLLTGFLLMLAARIVIVAYIIVLMFLIGKRVSSSYWRAIIVSILGLVSLAALFTVPILSDRMMELFDATSNSTNVRVMIYDCSLELAKEHWLFGAGLERLQFILDMCYAQFTAVNGETYFQYNTHNEYLNVLCGKGIIGLMAFLGLLIFLFRKVSGNALGVAFLVLFCFTCLTENLLDRQVGVFFFATFGSLFGILLAPQK